jgi:hypothetical protein
MVAAMGRPAVARPLVEAPRRPVTAATVAGRLAERTPAATRLADPIVRPSPAAASDLRCGVGAAPPVARPRLAPARRPRTAIAPIVSPVLAPRLAAVVAPVFATALAGLRPGRGGTLEATALARRPLGTAAVSTAVAGAPRRAPRRSA